MKDPALERLWQARRSISERNGFDPQKLVAYYQRRSATKLSPQPSTSRKRIADKVAEAAVTYPSK